jgi:outer membrane lipoprotein-sorting protein
VCAGEPPGEALTAEQILARMAKSYADCSSYRDAGEVTTVFFGGMGKRTVKKPFTTAFVRPDRFRFEFQERMGEEEWRRMIIWQGGGDVRSWWDLRPGVEHPSSLDIGLAGATGVSGSSAHNIPRLLLPDRIQGRSLTHLEELQRLPDAKFDGSDCFRVAGKSHGDPETLWIDKASFLVRRIDLSVQFPEFRTEETTVYHPEIDGRIAPGELEFRPTPPER